MPLQPERPSLLRRTLPAAMLLALLACGEGGTDPNEPVRVAKVQPAPGSSSAAVTTTVTVTFSRAVTVPADTTTVLWLERSGQPVSAQVSQKDARTLSLTPMDVLDPGTAHVLHLGSGLRDSDGHTLAATSWQFTTGGSPLPAVAGARMLAHVAALAADSMRGRGSGTADELKASQYIRQEYSSYGLTAYSGGQWLQSFVLSTGATSQNVIGVIAGQGSLKNEWVVIGGHYDHVGIRNGQIYNGADDNASGTAMVLELARTLAQYAKKGGFGTSNRRSLMFIAFGAEELGLLGSNFFCNTPLVPLPAIAGMINLDMVGRLRNGQIAVPGYGTAAEWDALLRRYGGGTQSLPMGDVGSDYRCFKSNQRPAVSLYTGTHPEYHKPTDDVGLINVGGMEEVGTLALGLAVNLAVRPHPLTWTEGN